eukprot:scaffold14658_cov67-Phaeocystis_antarctica.AAC.8
MQQRQRWRWLIAPPQPSASGAAAQAVLRATVRAQRAFVRVVMRGRAELILEGVKHVTSQSTRTALSKTGQKLSTCLRRPSSSPNALTASQLQRPHTQAARSHARPRRCGTRTPLGALRRDSTDSARRRRPRRVP